MKYTSRKTAALLLIFGILFMAQISFAALDEADIVSKNNLRVYLLNQDPLPAEPGRYVDLHFRILNYGSGDLQSVRAKLLVDYPFSFDDPADAEVNLGTLSGRQLDEYGALVEWKVRVDKNTIEGEHPVKVQIQIGDRVSYITEEFMIEVITQNPVLSVSSVKTIPDSAQAGGEVMVDITLENLADNYLKTIVATLSTAGTPFAPLDSTTERTIKLLESGKTSVVSYRLAVDSTAESQVHQLSLKLTYLDQTGHNFSKNLSVGIKVNNPPKYVLNLEETEVYENNQKGKIILSFSNIGSGDIHFVQMHFKDSPGLHLVSSPTVYLGNLESDDFQTAEYRVYSDTTEKEVNVNVEVTFTDEYNQEHTKTHQIPLRLYTTEEAVKYGIATAQGGNSFVVWFIVGILALMFWISMLADLIQSPHGKWKKLMWLIILVSTTVVGALVYYFIGRKKNA